MLAERPFEVTSPARAAGAHAQADHPPHHHEMAVAPVRKQLVDLGEGVEQFEW